MADKIILKGYESRAKLLKGMQEIADVVCSTLGPRGRNVIIEQSFGAPKITKDGVSVAKSLDLADKLSNLAAQLVKEAANKTNDTAGDGTTTTVSLTRALIEEGAKYMVSGMNPVGLKYGIEKATRLVVEELKRMSNPIESTDKVAQVATISANGDVEIGKKIAEAFEKVGEDGVVTVEEANKSDDFEVEVVKGMKFDRGFISPYFATNQEKMICEFESPSILLVDQKISSMQQLMPILEKTVQQSKPLVIIADDVEGEALATLVVNKMRGTLKVVAVKAPGFGDRKKEMFKDISILTGGELISEDLGNKLENVEISHLGSAKKVIVTKDDTVIVDGNGEQSKIDARKSQIRAQIDEATSEYDREKLQERLAKLSNGIAVLRVGDFTEVGLKEKKDRVTDAYNATKAAREEGIVCGGGCALLYAGRVLEKTQWNDEAEKAGMIVVREALYAPIKKILENAGANSALIISKLMEANDDKRVFDASKLEYVNADTAGIIDPVKVVRIALQSASSVAANFIITEGIIIERPEEKNSSNMNMPAGMGGMDGMGGF